MRRRELAELGLGWRAIDEHVRQGTLTPVGRGLYRAATAHSAPTVNGAPLPLAWEVLAARTAPDGVFVGQAAAWLWRRDGFDDHQPAPELAVPRSCGVRAPGVHRCTAMPAATIAPGVRTACIEHTLLTAADRLTARPGCRASRTALRPDELVELAVEHALREQLTTVVSLEDVIRTARTRGAGRRALRAVLARRPPGAPPTESYLETRLLQVLRRGGVVEPARQVELRDDGGRFVARVDLLLDHLVVEADSVAHHAAPDALARDRTRTNALHTLGYVVLGFTFEDIEHRPHRVVDTVERVRGRAPTRPGG